MKNIITILLAFCLGFGLAYLMFGNRTNKTDKIYQTYYPYCLYNAQNSGMDPETSYKLCNCVATEIVKSDTALDDLTGEELEDFAITCLGKQFLATADDE